MQSPVDPKATLTRFELLPKLEAWQCPTSGGIWIDGEAYWKWVREVPSFPRVEASIDPGSAPAVESTDSDAALISSRSGRLMTKFRVGKGLAFQIEFDRVSGGFWLDKGEYEILRSREMHDELHLICDAYYQRELRRLDEATHRQDRLARALGEEGKTRVEEFAKWASTHDQFELIRAYFLELLDGA